MSDENNKYRMSIGLNVLQHLGLSLYSNTPSVLSEVIANAWDADATEVRVKFSFDDQTITVTDNGIGMDITDINEKYLYVGYQKRTHLKFRTPGGRKPMGRKGIGKLSLFSIANKFVVYSRKHGGNREAFLMDAEEIKEAIQQENPSKPGMYNPTPMEFDVTIDDQGTVIKITELKVIRLTQASINGLRKRIARRFSFIGGDKFNIYINDSKVTFTDRDYFHKARFLFQYGSNHDYSSHCNFLDLDSDGNKLCEVRVNKFDSGGAPAEEGEFEIRGWIAIARRSNDLDDKGPEGEDDDNLNKITVAMRRKVAQEDILQEFRLGGMITKYIYGEIIADFLDEDEKDDIATSSRQRISEHDVRYRALKLFIRQELQYIWRKTNELKEKRGLQEALSNPHIKQWYENLSPKALKEAATKIFGEIGKTSIEESHKGIIYANGVLSFETLKMKYALDALDEIQPSNIDIFLEYLSDLDAIEAARYLEIVRERLAVITKLKDSIDENARERVLQEYIFDHLWLLDPAWERATEFKYMEESLQQIMGGTRLKDKSVRLDIRYRRVAGAHVIIELKRHSTRLSKVAIETQLRKYIDALTKELLNNPREKIFPIESVCIVGKLPLHWDNPEVRRRDEDSLKPYSIKVLTYEELISNAHSAYAKFIEASSSVDDLRQLIEDIKNYQPTQP